jgi:ABC-type phosphate/phosphonate transport system substrate-binding protein
MIPALVSPFVEQVNSQTGLQSQLISGGSPFHLAERLARGQVQLGIFDGVEFAWAHQKYPDLQAVALAINGKPYLRAFLIVPAGGARGISDLRGRSVAVPSRSHEHCYQFLARLCRGRGAEGRPFFMLTKQENAEDTLDDVGDGLLPAAVVEEACFDSYQRRKPGRAAQLKVLQQSEEFPVPTLAYSTGKVDNGMLRKLRDGLLNMKKDLSGREMLTLWHLTGFEPVPPDYQQTLQHIVQIYPRPDDSGALTDIISELSTGWRPTSTFRHTRPR